jgi:hypothetical protein
MEKRDKQEKQEDNEGQVAPTLKAQIMQVLRAESPLRAPDIVKKLAAIGVATRTTEVNKVLYQPPFEKVPNLGKPAWKIGAIPIVHPRPEGMHTFAIDGVAVVSIPVGLPVPQLQELLRTLLAVRNTFVGEHAFHAEDTEAGRGLTEQAQTLGFAVIGAPLQGTQ